MKPRRYFGAAAAFHLDRGRTAPGLHHDAARALVRGSRRGCADRARRPGRPADRAAPQRLRRLRRAAPARAAAGRRGARRAERRHRADQRPVGAGGRRAAGRPAAPRALRGGGRPCAGARPARAAHALGTRAGVGERRRARRRRRPLRAPLRRVRRRGGGPASRAGDALRDLERAELVEPPAPAPAGRFDLPAAVPARRRGDPRRRPGRRGPDRRARAATPAWRGDRAAGIPAPADVLGRPLEGAPRDPLPTARGRRLRPSSVHPAVGAGLPRPGPRRRHDGLVAPPDARARPARAPARARNAQRPLAAALLDGVGLPGARAPRAGAPALRRPRWPAGTRRPALAARIRRVRQVVWYQLAGPPKATLASWDSGLLGPRGTPRPVFRAVRGWSRARPKRPPSPVAGVGG